ncbi:MAG: PLP-dependent lyase/thiolase [Thermoanaerobaculia bacterium]
MRLVCHGCGTEVPLNEIRPYRCREGELHDDVDHVLRRRFDATTFRSWADPDSIFGDIESNPFRRYRRLFYSYEIARLGGLPDSEYLRIVDRLDAAIAAIDGHGFRETPFGPEQALAGALRLASDRLWIKNETGSVSGSHKARHLMGIMLWLEVIRSLRRPLGVAPRLAIASCGNAALAAAVVARAADRPLDVFVPPDANPRLTQRLTELGAELTTCPRRASDPPGDPCFHRFLEAWGDGSLPFTVQAKRNGLTIEGGCTLVWEIVSALRARSGRLDHLIIQVGGGALAAACIEGLKNAQTLGLIDRLPRIHTVQTASGYPLRRAYDRLVERLPGVGDPATHSGEDRDPAAHDRRALKIRDQVPPQALADAIGDAIHARSDFMRPWETEPRSIAYGILDDETYDWIAVTEGMLETGGVPLVVSEDTLEEAHRLALEHTSVPVGPTGSAGLAGLLQLVRARAIGPDETAAVLFTGVERDRSPASE